MSENNQNQEGQKTIVSFVVGLLIGGLIVWMFSGSPTEAPAPTDDSTATTTETTTNGSSDEDEAENGASDTPAEQPVPAQTMEIGEGSVSVSDQVASSRISLEAVTYPLTDGWIGVRDYMNGNLGGLLGVVRFSESEGLIPEEIILQRPTEAGKEYAVVFYTPSDSNQFNLANNTQVEGIFATFTAQ